MPIVNDKPYRYDPNVHHRRSVRLTYRDYSASGLYFVTVCCREKECLLGHIEEAKMILSGMGKVAEEVWLEIPQHFSNVCLKNYCLMPNHLHGILEILNDESAQISNKLEHGTAGTLGSIVRGFKTGVTQRIGYSIWQRSYYEHVIRNSEDLENISTYIENNALAWWRRGHGVDLPE